MDGVEGDGDGGGVDGTGLVGKVEVVERDGVGVEGVGGDDVGAGVEVLGVDGADEVGVGEVKEVVEGRGWGEGLGLNEGAHGAIEEEGALVKLSEQEGVVVHHGAKGKHILGRGEGRRFCGREVDRE